jgi:hypothetical protein
VLRQYEFDLHEGDKLCAQLYMLMGGGPPRADEMLTSQWTNSQSIMRNFYVIFGHVAMLTMYNKSEVMANAPRVVARFYPARVGRLSLAIVAEAFPFLAYLQSAAGEPVEMDAKMWRRAARQMDSTDVTKALRKTTKAYLGVELGIRPLRQVLIGIDRELVRQPLAEARDESVRGAYEAQTGHSEATEEHNYAIQLSDLTHTNSKTLRAYFSTSSRSHELYGINDTTIKAEAHNKTPPTAPSSTVGVDTKLESISMIIQTVAAQVQELTLSVKKPSSTSLDEATTTITQVLSSDSDKPNVKVDTKLMYGLLRTLYGGSAEFKPGQLEACRQMLTGWRDLFVQLPTGGGKTLLVEMSALHDRGKVNLVFVPYNALREDMEKRLRKAGVKACAFTNENMGHMSVVLVNPEQANTMAFRRFWEKLRSGGKIMRVFWDECHLIEMEAKKRSGEDYRPYQKVLEFCAKPMLDVEHQPQRIFLSATLPADVMKAVQEKAKAADAEIVRRSTSRPSLRWEVQRSPAVDMDSNLQQLVRSAAPGKVIVYVLSCTAGEDLEERFGWRFYRGGMKEEGKELLKAFDAGSENVLVATTAAGSGWDTDARLVVLYGGAFDAITATQQAGRAGRVAGTIGRCVTLVNEDAVPRKVVGPAAIAWSTFIMTRGCRRVAIESYIDDCWRPPCHDIEEKCDNCAVLGIDNFDTIRTPDLVSLGVAQAIGNTIHGSNSSLLDPHDMELWSSPPEKFRKREAPEDKFVSPPRKREKVMGIRMAPLEPEQATFSSDEHSRSTLLSGSFEMLSSSSTGHLLQDLQDSPLVSKMTASMNSQSTWNRLLAWDVKESTTRRQDRVTAALCSMQTERVWCVYCWFGRLDRFGTNHHWDACATRRRDMPNVGKKELDGLKLTMKNYFKSPQTPTSIKDIHLNCWAPLQGLHPPKGHFDMRQDCVQTGRLLAVVETGLRDAQIGKLLSEKFRVHAGDNEITKAVALLRSSPGIDSSIVLWDAFLLLYGYRTQM